MSFPTNNHKPVLLKEVFEILKPQPGEFFVDGTLGLAGHATEALKRISPNGLFLGVDRDDQSAKKAEDILVNYTQENEIEKTEIVMIVANFVEVLEKMSKNWTFGKPNCFFLDLGFSSDQIFSGRGFSYDQDEPLIMRYDGDVRKLTAARVVNEYDRKKLSEILREYGEERFADRIADGIVKKRQKKPLRTTKELVEAIRESLPANYPPKKRPEARTFLALRNFINREPEDLKKAMGLIPQAVAKGGRVAVITFNSLEDRIVKKAFKKLSESGTRLLTKKPITPTRKEISQNNRARSAKLRAIQIS